VNESCEQVFITLPPHICKYVEFSAWMPMDAANGNSSKIAPHMQRKRERENERVNVNV
jgi:hypothetical protein